MMSNRKKSHMRTVEELDGSQGSRQVVNDNFFMGNPHVMSDIYYCKSSIEGLELPKVELSFFDGRSRDYFRFMRQIETFIEPRIKDEQVRLLYLIHYCKGKAKNAIEGCIIMDPQAGYKRAKAILKQLFGQSHVIARETLEDLFRTGNADFNDPELLTNLAIKMQNAALTLEQLNCTTELNSMVTLERIVRLLPRRMQAQWAELVIKWDEEEREPNFNELTEFIMSRAKIASSRFGRLAYQVKTGNNTEATSGLRARHEDFSFLPKARSEDKRFVNYITKAYPDEGRVCDRNDVKPLDACPSKKPVGVTDKMAFLSIEKKEKGEKCRHQDGSEVCDDKSLLAARKAWNGYLDSSKQRLMSSANMNKAQAGLTERNKAYFRNPSVRVNYITGPRVDSRISDGGTVTAKKPRRHDATITKKPKPHALSDATTSHGNSSHQNLSSDSDNKEIESVSSPLIGTSLSTSSNEPPSVSTPSDLVTNVKLIEDAQGCATVTVHIPVDCQSSDDEKKVFDGNGQSTALCDDDAIDEHKSCVSETDANAHRIDATCLTERNHDDVDNKLDVTDVTNELPTMTNTDQTSSVSGDGKINIDPTSCYLKSSGDDEMSKLEIPPSHIIYGSKTSVDKLASRTSWYLLIGASGGGLATRPHDRECSLRIGYDQFYDVLFMFVWVNWVRFILPLGHSTIDRGIKGLMGKYRYLVNTIGHIHVGWRVGVLL
ncbi:unnamed protein product [Schistosoma turkestanicum]|nr:unnamed protein product [Schistosoma turkestanicum]